MIVITGRVTAKPGVFAQLQAAALDHSARSRAEDGCLEHRCYLDAIESNVVFFYEEWRDMAAVKAHFAHPDTPRIMATIGELAATTEGPMIYAVEGVRQP